MRRGTLRQSVGIYHAGLPQERYKRVRHALLVLAVASAMYVPFLGLSGFAHSEGFRVYPGWEMLECGDWVVPRLFGQAYLRKPPLAPWLHGAAAWMFGQSEFVARGVSSAAIIAMCLASFAFAQRWFGGPWGLTAGLSCCVMPLMYWYPPGRAAEIEPVHACCTLIAVCLMIDRVLAPRRTLAAGVAITWGLALAFAGMLLSKGPAGVPVVVGVIAAVYLATRRGVLALWPGTLAMLLAGTLVFGVWFTALRGALAHESAPAVVEPPARFLFKDGKVLPALLMPASALVAGLPLSLALAWMPWRPARESLGRYTVNGDAQRRAIACSLAWTVALALAIYTLLGIANDRYATPALALLPLCVAAAGERCWGVAARARTREFGALARRARMLLVTLLVVAAGQIAFAEHRRLTRTSGKPDALRLGDVLRGARADHVELWGDQMVDARPEVLRYACDRAYSRGEWVTPRWKPRRVGEPPTLPPPGSYLIVRTDAMRRDAGEEAEWPIVQAAGVGAWPLVFEGKAHNFEYRVYQSPAP